MAERIVVCFWESGSQTVAAAGFGAGRWPSYQVRPLHPITHEMARRRTAVGGDKSGSTEAEGRTWDCQSRKSPRLAPLPSPSPPNPFHSWPCNRDWLRHPSSAWTTQQARTRPFSCTGVPLDRAFALVESWCSCGPESRAEEGICCVPRKRNSRRHRTRPESRRQHPTPSSTW